MTTDNYLIQAHNGLEVSATDVTVAAVVQIDGKSTLAGDLLKLSLNSGMTGKAMEIVDENGNVLFSITKAGAVTAASTLAGSGLQLKRPVVAEAASGAVAVPSADTNYFITKAASAADLTIVDPTVTTHDGLELTFIATTAQAHTLSNAAGSGFFSSGGATKDVATFGGAIGDRITIIAYQGKWYIKDSLNITLG